MTERTRQDRSNTARTITPHSRVAGLGAVLLAGVLAGLCHAGPTVIAQPDQPTAQIIHAADAGEPTAESAGVLADYLARITGRAFEVLAVDDPASGTSDGRPRIVLGTIDDDLPITWQSPGQPGVDAADLPPDAYRLLSDDRGLWLVGVGEVGLRYAVWDVLHRLGYRQFFPGPTWEVIPEHQTLTLDVDRLETPDYRVRRIWYNWGQPYNADTYADWNEKNRMPGDFVLNTGHVYGHIIRRFKDVFDAHPEYYALVDGERHVFREAKFCASNPGLQQVVIDSALQRAGASEDVDSISMDPSDGGGWCECVDCQAIGTPSDQALFLANIAAEALEAAGYDISVGMYAYNEHSPPPTRVRAHPKVIMSVATAFLRGGYSIEDIFEGWRAMGVQQFGVRGYYSVFAWDRNMPGAARASNPKALAEQLVDLHEMGARLMSTESGDAWGPYGIGYYIAGRVMWDTEQADQTDAMIDDFLARAFPGVESTMRRFVELLYPDRRPFVSQDLIGRMYRLLAEASEQNRDPAVQARLDDLILYTRYADLYHRFDQAKSAEQRAHGFEQVIRHTWRIRRTGMVHMLAIYRTLDNRTGMSLPAEAEWNVPEPQNPWKSSEPFTREELDSIVAQGVADHQLAQFEPASFSRDLVPAGSMLGVPPPDGEPIRLRGRGERVYYTWIDEPPAEIDLTVTGGLIAHYRDRGDVQVQLYHADNPDFPMDAAAVPPDGQTRQLTLRTDQPGLHRLVVSDGMDMTELIWPGDLPITWESSGEARPWHVGRDHYVFFVPPGTAVVGGYNDHAASASAIRFPDGAVAADLSDRADHFVVPVPDEAMGKLWLADRVAGRVALMTVPPFVSRRAELLLLPREVVEAYSNVADHGDSD